MSEPKITIIEQIKIRVSNYISYLANSYNARILIVIPFILGLIVIAFSTINGDLNHLQNIILACATFFIWGFCGILIIALREVPGTFTSIKGTYAIIIGGIVTIFFWGLAIRGVILILTNGIE